MSGILLIDDAQIMRQLFRNVLQNVGYTVCGEAENGKEGIRKFRELKPDLVFCDIMMSEMDGYGFLKQAMNENPNAKVVICTSVGDTLHMNDAKAAGAVDFIAKPIKAADVISITEKYIGKPLPAPKVSYKELMEQRAAAVGIPNKHVLDFFEAFKRINDFGFGDSRVDKQYLENNSDGIIIGTRALISAKMSTADVDQLMSIFKGLTS